MLPKPAAQLHSLTYSAYPADTSVCTMQLPYINHRRSSRPLAALKLMLHKGWLQLMLKSISTIILLD
jgi:hypothetical protein